MRPAEKGCKRPSSCVGRQSCASCGRASDLSTILIRMVLARGRVLARWVCQGAARGFHWGSLGSQCPCRPLPVKR